MRKILVILFIIALTVIATGNVLAKTIQGEAFDPNYQDQLGLIKYLGNSSGYHFWFTAAEDLRWYTAGHSYHNEYKFEIENPSEWCPLQALVPDRVPYNQVAIPGIMVWYKIYDLTLNQYVCGL